MRALNSPFSPAGLPDRNIQGTDNRERAVRLSGVCPNRPIICTEGQRRKSLGPCGGKGALRGADLRLRSFQIRPLITSLLKGVLKCDRGRGRKRNVVGEIEPVRWRQSGKTSQIYLLLRKIVLQGTKALLLGENLDLAPVHIDLCRRSDSPPLRCLLKQCVRRVALRARRGNPRLSGDHLHEGASDRESNRAAR